MSHYCGIDSIIPALVFELSLMSYLGNRNLRLYSSQTPRLAADTLQMDG